MYSICMCKSLLRLIQNTLTDLNRFGNCSFWQSRFARVSSYLRQLALKLTPTQPLLHVVTVVRRPLFRSRS